MTSRPITPDTEAELIRLYVHDKLGWPYWTLADPDDGEGLPAPVPTAPPLDSGVWASFREARQAALESCRQQVEALEGHARWLEQVATPGLLLRECAESEGWHEDWRPDDWADPDPEPVEVRFRVIGNGRPTSPRALQCQLCDEVLPDMTTSTAEAHQASHQPT